MLNQIEFVDDFKAKDFIAWQDGKFGHSNFGVQSVFVLDGNNMYNKETVLTEFRTHLNFPSGMGNNFDSLDECLDVFNWPDVKQFILVIKNTNLFIKNCDADVVKAVFTVLGYAAETWGKRYRDKHAFCVVLDIPKD
jgi:RNAse (barnase) inhibitor barstar